MCSQNLFVLDFTRRFFVRCVQIFEAYAVRTLIKFERGWRKIGRKSKCRKDSESTFPDFTGYPALRQNIQFDQKAKGTVWHINYTEIIPEMQAQFLPFSYKTLSRVTTHACANNNRFSPSSGYSQSASLLAHNQITASQFIRMGLYPS